MSLMSDLLETYNVAYDEGLVDDTYLNNDGPGHIAYTIPAEITAEMMYSR